MNKSLQWIEVIRLSTQNDYLAQILQERELAHKHGMTIAVIYLTKKAKRHARALVRGWRNT